MSTASRLLFSGLPREVSSSPAVVVTKAPDFTRAGHRIVQSFSRFFLQHRSHTHTDVYPTDTSQCAVGSELANRASPLQIQPAKTRPPPGP